MPDSLLQDITAFIADNAAAGRHIITANEGNAVALAVGHYLATGRFALVYMQNSGLGNAINPLVSLSDPLVYKIPLLLLIGWRGEPGIKDEPQHLKQGLITLPLLDTIGIRHVLMPETEREFLEILNEAKEYMYSRQEPYAIIARKNSFEIYKSEQSFDNIYSLKREEALGLILSRLKLDDVVVSTTGKLSREIYEYRKNNNERHWRDFLNVGSMGHASQIALGIALNKADRKIYCLDGDGAVLMHMGALAIIGNSGYSNLRHVIFNNGAHDSVGGQQTVGFDVDFCSVARACGYRVALRADSKKELSGLLDEFYQAEGPCLLEVRICKGAREDLGRPLTTPQENKQEFMKSLTK